MTPPGSPADWFMVAAWAFALASHLGGPFGAGCALVGTCALGLGRTRPRPDAGPGDGDGRNSEEQRVGPWLALQLASVGILVPRPAGLHTAVEIPMAVAGAAVNALAAAWLLWVSRRRAAERALANTVTTRSSLALVVILVLGLVGTGVPMIRAAAHLGDDVVQVHVQAAAAIAHGQSPYGPAVNTTDTSPLAAPGDRIIGYTYPPLPALAYAAATWLLDDPRWTSLIALALLVALLGRRAAIADDTRAPRAPRQLATVLLLASFPVWPRVLEQGWTEPFSLLLLALSALSWAQPIASSVALGLALASKQYFVLAAPALVFGLPRTSRGRLRLFVMLGTLAAATLPILLIDARGFLQAGIVFVLTRPHRPDGMELARIARELAPGLSWPRHTSVLALVVCWVGGAALGRRTSPTGVELWSTLALVMAVGLLLTQAMANYCYLAAGLCALAAFTSAQAPSAQR